MYQNTFIYPASTILKLPLFQSGPFMLNLNLLLIPRLAGTKSCDSVVDPCANAQPDLR